MPKPIATWNPARCVWETERTNLFCGHSEPFLGTWPTSGMTRSGVAYPLPPWAHPTDGSASSLLLKTPTAQLAQNGGSQHPDKRRQGGHGPTLADEIEHLLPTPQASDTTKHNGQPPEKRKAAGHTVRLADAAMHLLPTPTANDWKGAGPLDRRPAGDDDLSTRVERLLPTPTVADADGTRAARGGARSNELLLTGIAREVSTGASTNQPSDSGKPSSDAQPLPRPWWELVEDGY